MPISVSDPTARRSARRMRVALLSAGFFFLSVVQTAAFAQLDSAGFCNLDLRNPFGPFDYRTASADKREIVEINHFNENVESLIKGQTGPIGGDLAYTLRAFPNHPRALMAMARLARKEGNPKPKGSNYTAECWFERALEFQPEDPDVHLVYGIELLRNGKVDQAIEQLRTAEKSLGNSPNVAYNLGLAYFDSNDFDKALTYAHKAYALGFPLPGLRDKLVRSGHWKDN